MQIIDRYKDYYDHFSKIYPDKSVIFDRRGSEQIEFEKLVFGFSRKEYHKHFQTWSDVLFLLEIGYKQYLFEISEINIDSQGQFVGQYLGFDQKFLKSYSLNLLRVFEENSNYFGNPISVIPNVHIQTDYIKSGRHWEVKGRKQKLEGTLKQVVFFKRNETISKDNVRIIYKNPNLDKLGMSKFLDAFEVWKELDTYISSLKNDRDVDIFVPDSDKVVNHGFDKKTSFRRM